MKSILAKLTPEEIKELSKAIQAEQKKLFGNPLSLRKQEQLMADIFKVKNWSTLLGTSTDYDPKSPYQKTIIQVEVLSDSEFNYEDLSDLDYAITNGDCVGSHRIISRESLDKKTMDKELIRLGSDPSFFPGKEFTTDETIVFEHLCEVLKRQNPDLWNNAYSDVIAQELIKIFKSERDYAITQFNRANSNDELRQISKVHKILAKDKLDYTEDDFIILLRD